MLCAASVAACGPSESDRSTIEQWLGCIECTAGELTAASAVGKPAVILLGEVLVQQAQSSALSGLSRQLGRRWQDLGDPTIDSTTYVSTFVETYVATAEARAATALGMLAGSHPAALAILRDALLNASTRGYRPDVVGAVQQAILSLGLGNQGQITVTVVDPATQTGVAGVQVAAFACATSRGAQIPPAAGRCESYGSPPAPQTETTDAAGSVTFQGLFEGNWEIRPQPVAGTTDPAAALVLLVGQTPTAQTSFEVQPTAGVAGIPDRSVNTGLDTWTVSISSLIAPAGPPALVQLKRTAPAGELCFVPDSPFSQTTSPCFTASNDINYQVDDGVAQIDLAAVPGTSEGYWSLVAKVVDGGGTLSDSVTRVTLNDVTPPVIGGIAVPSSLPGLAGAIFSGGVDDNIEVARVDRSLAYGALVIADTAFLFGTYGQEALTQNGNVTLEVPSLVRSMESTLASGRASGTVTGMNEVRFRAVDVAGNSATGTAGTINQVLASAGGSLPSLLSSDPTNFAPANPSHGNFQHQAPAPAALCSATVNCQPTSALTTTLAATMTGPTGIFVPPFVRVDFYWQDPIDDHWSLIATTSALTLTDDGITTRTARWSVTWTVTGLTNSAGAPLLGAIPVMAVGVVASGSALVTSGTPHSVTLTAS